MLTSQECNCRFSPFVVRGMVNEIDLDWQSGVGLGRGLPYDTQQKV